MSKVKYYYDSETLSYRKVERKKGRTFGAALIFIAATALMGLLITIAVFNSGVDTPKERKLERELANMSLQFEIQEKKLDQIERVLANVEERDNNVYRVLFEASPIPDEIRQAGFGGVNRYKDLEGFDNSSMITGSAKRIDQITKRLVIQSKSLDEIAKLAEEKEALLKTIPAIQPVQNKDLSRVASGYGMRVHPILKYRKMHNGMDFTAPPGTPIYATGDGKVTKVGLGSGYGKMVIIEHGFGYKTYYAHMSKYKATVGQNVKRGEIIGYVGNTGLSSGPHLHYEVWKNGTVVNPVNFYHNDLTPEEYDLMLAASSIENQSLD
ncbi:M23 family metallopeptidase [uncultured Dokdonia sp.]|mgnify:CR=1 FL=1|jgi:murein DD-endopeptidase MepM/ murein hydrolase activator NlpD|uniref:M23 family metallopeptidase n=1 Tax=unclassified Dokdonia TaxID=2615033 RepID=UPI002619EFE4|nr:M23 family metallopeptidase [uncultured Dokdonia sp.]|tara:strand:+ start:27309 stop:28280 length:972 start_codon:yes stop_codon:yes gene_type:complete